MQAAYRSVRKSKVKKSGQSRTRSVTSVNSENTCDKPTIGVFSRTKSLLFAALRVWELKDRGGK